MSAPTAKEISSSDVSSDSRLSSMSLLNDHDTIAQLYNEVLSPLLQIREIRLQLPPKPRYQERSERAQSVKVLQDVFGALTRLCQKLYSLDIVAACICSQASVSDCQLEPSSVYTMAVQEDGSDHLFQANQMMGSIWQELVRAAAAGSQADGEFQVVIWKMIIANQHWRNRLRASPTMDSKLQSTAQAEIARMKADNEGDLYTDAITAWEKLVKLENVMSGTKTGVTEPTQDDFFEFYHDHAENLVFWSEFVSAEPDAGSHEVPDLNDWCRRKHLDILSDVQSLIESTGSARLSSGSPSKIEFIPIPLTNEQLQSSSTSRRLTKEEWRKAFEVWWDCKLEALPDAVGNTEPSPFHLESLMCTHLWTDGLLKSPETRIVISSPNPPCYGCFLFAISLGAIGEEPVKNKIIPFSNTEGRPKSCKIPDISEALRSEASVWRIYRTECLAKIMTWLKVKPGHAKKDAIAEARVVTIVES